MSRNELQPPCNRQNDKNRENGDDQCAPQMRMIESKSFTPADSVMPQEEIDQEPGHTLKTQCADNHQSESFCLSETGNAKLLQHGGDLDANTPGAYLDRPEKQNCLKA